MSVFVLQCLSIFLMTGCFSLMSGVCSACQVKGILCESVRGVTLVCEHNIYVCVCVCSCVCLQYDNLPLYQATNPVK